jgi:hypothetical protein
LGLDQLTDEVIILMGVQEWLLLMESKNCEVEEVLELA